MMTQKTAGRSPFRFACRALPSCLGILLLLLFYGCRTAGFESAETGAELQELYDAKEFFLFLELFSASDGSLEPEDAAYFRALALALENRSGESCEAISEFLSIRSDSSEPGRGVALGFLEIDNRIRTGEYGEALAAIDFLLSNYADFLGEEDIADLRNTRILFDFLKDVPPTAAITGDGDSVFPLEFDALGLLSLRGGTAAGSVDFVLDTGANFSVVGESVAERLGLDVATCDFDVTAGATGVKIPSRIAVADSLEVGSLILRNAVFLVFEDEALSFPDIGEEIDAILGFPVLDALGEIRFNFEDAEVTVPREARDYPDRNLLFDGMQPLLAIEHGEEPMTFLLDTGADRTLLYEPYLRRNPDAVESGRSPESLSLGGAGGRAEARGFEDLEATLSAGGKTGSLRDLTLVTDSQGVHGLYAGILGRDFLFQWDEMILSFASSSLLFR